jgi:hypothetical protein
VCRPLRWEIVAKDAVTHDTFSLRAVVGMEGGDATSFDLGNVNRHDLDLNRSDRLVHVWSESPLKRTLNTSAFAMTAASGPQIDRADSVGYR